MKELDFKITIVGLGLIGGSLAMSLRDLNPQKLWAVDIDENVLKDAEKLGVIDKGYINSEIPLKESDLVIISLYPDLAIKFIKENINNFKSNAIITDTAGTKEKIVEEVNSFIRNDLDFIGGHPMCGSECKGFKNASKNIFKEANYILTPMDKNKEKNINVLEKIINDIGCKNIVKVSPKKHDTIIAYTSQLPHVLATTLINSNQEENANLFIGGSFKDATRVANINTDLWPNLIIENKENIINQLKNFEENINDIKNAIINEDVKTLKEIFDKGSAKKEELK